MDAVTDVLLDTVLDVLKLLPFLFAAYLFLEWMETQSEGKLETLLERFRRSAPLIGSLLAVFPSCGFSGASSSLYATGVISLGTLMAVYLSTNDEMLPIMLSAGVPSTKILPILLVKLVISLFCGYALDLLVKKRKADIDAFCEREHDDHSHGILHSAVLHTVQVAAWLFAITLLFNGIVEWIGMDRLGAFIASYPNKSVLFAGIVGMIPNCASSVLLSAMYAEGVLSFPAVCTGLLANAGTGMMILWRVNPDKKENAVIMFLLWGISLVSGALLNLIF